MSDIIQLLPDSVANQIAAGEVIQRPASVIKELVENAIDAGATKIQVNLKDAGRTLIQVNDNGCGMSETDARMAFERHATSKIKTANDLFAIRTMGFRGEALASIAAIADVELRTKPHDKEVGTFIYISGSNVVTQEPVSCPAGTNFQVKNLFFNVPARRKFLKKNATELKHIITEFQRIALSNPEVALSLHHNQSAIYDLPTSNRRLRIVNIFGRNINQNLIPIDTETSLINIKGFIGQPKHARKTFGEQFFFVNQRYMRHPFFHRAVMQAYEKILPPDTIPSYFIYFEIPPDQIDINIHPTKTEIKFENESAIWRIVNAALRESIGKFNMIPSIDFDQSGSVDIPLPTKDVSEVKKPEIQIDPTYNPFEKEKPSRDYSSSYSTPKKEQTEHWECLYSGIEKDEDTKAVLSSTPEPEAEQTSIENNEKFSGTNFIQFKKRYVLTPVKSGLMVIDQKRAHERILFEQFMQVLKSSQVASQQQLFPHTFELNAVDAALLTNILDDLQVLGFDVCEFGKNTFVINGTPGILNIGSPQEVIESMLEEYKQSVPDVKEKVREKLAASLAKASAINYGQLLQPDEIRELIDSLFACHNPNFSPTGKKVLTILPIDDFEKMLK